VRILDGLKPEKVFEYFEEISAIPRGSGNTDNIRDYCVDFAKKRGCEYIADEWGNVVIFKPAFKNEKSEPVIIQGHLDMVWEKDETSNINFETDGLELAVDGDFVRANGTTLGGDDGIAVAMCLALLDSDDIPHPPLEIVLTADEEVGMTGAGGLDTSMLKSKRMINLDSEQEGVLWVSCAGGVRADILLDVEYEDNEDNTFEICVSNLHGGHSGAEIHKGYANANKVMGRVLEMLRNKIKFSVCEINGGTMDNAITRDSKCIISSEADVIGAVKEISDRISDEYKSTDPDISITAVLSDESDKTMTFKSSNSVIDVLNDLPSGVIAMSKEIDGLVETSLNLGILKTVGNTVLLNYAVRSGKDAEKEKLCSSLCEICKKHSCKIEFRSSYPAWEFKPDSELRETMSAIYKEMFGKEMEVTAIHAGLECGLFCGKIDGLDCVSLGPNMFDSRTPKECLSISSCERVWNYLLRVLETI